MKERLKTVDYIKKDGKRTSLSFTKYQICVLKGLSTREKISVQQFIRNAEDFFDSDNLTQNVRDYMLFVLYTGRF